MRRLTLTSAVVVALFAGCSSSGSDKPSVSSVPSTTTGSTTTTTSGPTATTSTTAPVTTTTVACPGVGTTEPIVTAKKGTTALLRAVATSGSRCGDRVMFDFTTTANAPPRCTLVYTAPPFTMDGSGAPVAVSGSAFVRMRCEPAYGYDF